MSSLSPGPVPCAIASNHGGWQGVAVLPLCTSLQVRCRCGNTRMNVTLHYDLVTILMTMHRCDSATVAIRCRTVRIRPDCQVSDLLLIRCNHDHHCNIITVAFIAFIHLSDVCGLINTPISLCIDATLVCIHSLHRCNAYTDAM